MIGALAVPASLAIASLVREYLVDSVKVGTRFMIPYRISLDKHLCILGPTRAGKSSLVRAIIDELNKKYVVTVLDWHGEYAGILPTLPTSAIKIELNRLPPKLLTEILGFGLGLNEPSMYMLYRIIRDGNYSSFNDLIGKIDNYLVNTRTEAEMKAAILRRLEYSASNIGSGIISIDRLMEGDSIIDLSDLTIIEEKRLVSSLILASMYMHYMRKGLIERGVRHILIIEEAQNLLNADESGYSIIDHVIMELAKYGLRAVLVSNVIPKSSLLKHCNVVLFKINPELLGDEISISRDLVKRLGEMSAEEVLVITNGNITRVRPVRSTMSPKHIVVRKLEIRSRNAHPIDEDVMKKAVANNNEDENNNGGIINQGNSNINNGGNNGIATVSKALNLVGVNNAKNGSSMGDDSPFKKQVMELEREVINLRDRINEIERILEADEKIIEKILELDDKLKNNQA